MAISENAVCSSRPSEVPLDALQALQKAQSREPPSLLPSVLDRQLSLTLNAKSLLSSVVNMRLSSAFGLLIVSGKQRVVVVDGHPILRINNYDLNNSLSVYDHELRGALSNIVPILMT